MGTLKQIVDKLNQIASSSPLFHTFGDGNPWEITAAERKYPMIWVDTDMNMHNISDSFIKFNIVVWFMDRVNADESNELQIKSDTFESALDYIKILKDNLSILKFDIKDQDIVAQTFTEFYDDNLSGTKVSFSITRKGAGSSCNSKNQFSV